MRTAGFDFGGFIIAMVVVAIVALVRRSQSPIETTRWCCRNCGRTVVPIPQNNVNGCFLVVLLCCFIIPGILYWVWSGTQKTRKCPSCGAKDNFVPSDSPEGSRLAESAAKQHDSPVARSERGCPWCAEQILVAAKVCKHCKQAVD